MKKNVVITYALLLLGILAAAIVWPLWYNRYSPIINPPANATYFVQYWDFGILSYLGAVPALVLLLSAFIVSKKTNNKRLKIISLAALILMLMVVLLFAARQLDASLHPPVPLDFVPLPS